MPFVKIHISSSIKLSTREKIVKEVREALVKTIDIKFNHGHVIVYDSPVSSRCVHESRHNNFVMVEIIMFPGRSADIKENLFHSVTKIIKNHTGLKEEDILITIIESERYNWAKGGIALSKIDLGY